MTTRATAETRPHATITYRPLAGATDVDVYLAWREPPTHPAVADLLDLIREIASVGEPAQPSDQQRGRVLFPRDILDGSLNAPRPTGVGRRRGEARASREAGA